jgi:hypothetical protein
MLTGIIKSMPGYAQHHRAGVCWPKEGREFIVGDEKTLQVAGVEAKKLYDERCVADTIGEGVANPDMPVVYHVATPTATNPKLAVVKRGRIIDVPTRPVVMDQDAYEYLKEAFGVYLHCEPIGGGDALGQAQRITQLEHENEQLREELAQYKGASKMVAGSRK